MEVRTEGVGRRFLHAVRRIDDNAVGVFAVICDSAGLADGTRIVIRAIVGNSVQSVGRGIINRCTGRPVFIQVPDADVVAPGLVVRDILAVINVVAHEELGALLHLRELDPHELLAGVSDGFVDVPGILVAGKAGTVFRKEGQVIAHRLAVHVFRRHVRKAEAGDAGFRDAHEHGEVDERLAASVAIDLQLDLVVEVRHRERIGGGRIDRRKRGGEDEE